MAKNRNGIKNTVSDRIFNVVIISILFILNLIMLYPFIYIISTSISDPGQVMAGKVWLFPKGFDTLAYKQMLQHTLFGSAYINTIFYSISATIVTLIATCLTAYPLSRPNFQMKSVITKIYLFTMFFNGGMIPTYLAIKNLGLVDSRWVMILPAALSAWNIILMRSFFQNIPESLHESAYLDGANDLIILWKIVVPLSKPIVATIALFTMVGVWNDFFSALIYLNDSALFPLQLILRMILVTANMAGSAAQEASAMDFMNAASTESLKSAAILISIIPIICVYPFAQKYFVKGVMVGSVKG